MSDISVHMNADSLPSRSSVESFPSMQLRRVKCDFSASVVETLVIPPVANNDKKSKN